jgi:hypothetical protein
LEQIKNGLEDKSANHSMLIFWNNYLPEPRQAKPSKALLALLGFALLDGKFCFACLVRHQAKPSKQVKQLDCWTH